MKLNNRGFAISSIMYIILVMCIILITVTLSIFSSRNLILDKQKKETLSNIYNEEGYNRPSIPELIDGLTPIKYNGSNWVVADTSKEWYNYSKQEWANAAILDNPFKSNTYSGVTKNNGYASFDGVDDYMDLGLENYDFGKNLTFAIRFRPKNVKWQEILGNWENAGGGFGYQTDRIYFGLYIKEKGDYYNADALITPSTNSWYTVVGTYDGSNIKIYVNGSLMGTTSVSGTTQASTVQISLGSNPSPSNHYNYSNADVKAVDIYNRTLSETEIKNGYSEEIEVQNETGLLKHVDFTTPKVGEVVPTAGMNAMFVWIPRYEYKIEGTYGKGGTSATNPGEIEVRFVSKNRSGLKDEYRVHPAFTFGDEELSGIWVGKFETSHATLSSNTANNLNCSNENCANADGLRILPSVAPLTNNTVSNFFFAARSMTRNGNGFALNLNDANSHMMKNNEWGAVAYLSQSKYGKYGNSKYIGVEKQIRINNCYNSNYTTGIGASSQNESQSATTCVTNTYETANGQAASTTGNITGIYDMSGGSYEYVMGVLLDSSGNPRSGSDNSYNSGFTGTLSSGTTYNGISFPNFKYYNTYTSTDSSSTNVTISKTACSGEVCYGHALSETSQWYGDSFGFVSANNPWIYRGGGSADSSWAGVFASNIDRGRNSVAISFRIVISPNP